VWIGALLAAAVLATAGCGGDRGDQTIGAGQPASTRTSPAPSQTAPADTGKTTGGGSERSGADPYSEGAGDAEAPLVTAVRAYVRAIDGRDGKRACALLAPGALRGVHLPHPAGGCAQSLSASIGYTPPGEAAWRRSLISRVGPVEIDPEHPGEARVRALVVHRFDSGREPSIEDDLVYLREVRGRWLIAKASSTLYRAIGARDVPLTAITPPAR
jgi:hypothetical protein